MKNGVAYKNTCKRDGSGLVAYKNTCKRDGSGLVAYKNTCKRDGSKLLFLFLIIQRTAI